MGMNSAPGSSQMPTVEASVSKKKTLEEKRAALVGLKIDDENIIGKLAAILGTDEDAFNSSEVAHMKEYYSQRKGHWEDNLGWQEWKIAKTGDTLFANNDGTFSIKG